jgi:hypothetical protein
MFTRRSVASIAGLVMLASTISVAGSTASASAAPRTTSPQQAPVAARAAVGTPSRNYVMPSGAAFSFPNRGKADKFAIRNRVLFTIQSVWGGPRDRNGLPLPTNGTIRIATWSFNDMGIAKALVAAHNRGVSVQVMAAASRNKTERGWKLLKRKLGARYYKAGVPNSSDKVSFARQCRGACRGRGGTPHSKYFLFNNVGSAHVKNVVMQTSANLTNMGYQGQWNQAQTFASPYVYNNFLAIFRETRLGIPQSAPYRRYTVGRVSNIFFPRPGTSGATDPVMAALNPVRCTGAATPGGRTKIRVIQYAIYDNRGVWLSKKLRSLWNAGCDVSVIYSVATRPILQILRNGSGRGAIPMRQSVITNSQREIKKYNHSKWMTIAGRWGGSTAAYVTFAGSANWSSAAFGNDEQMQQIVDYNTTRAYMINFNRTWVQGSSHAPGFGVKAKEERQLPSGLRVPPGNKVPWGKGIYKYMTPEG